MTYKPRDNRLRSQETVSLSAEIDRFVERAIPKKARAGLELQLAWEKAASSNVLSHTDTVMFSKREKEPVVIVYVDDSAWAAELNMQKESYRLKLQDSLARPITEVRFFVSRITALRKK